MTRVAERALLFLAGLLMIVVFGDSTLGGIGAAVATVAIFWPSRRAHR